MKTILVATDLTPASANATRYAVQLAKATGSRIHLVYVHRTPISAFVDAGHRETPDGGLEISPEQRLLQEVNWLRSSGVAAVDGVATSGSKAGGLVREAGSVQAELVVMGRKAERQTVFGSTVTQMIRKSHTPVLIVPENTTYVPVKHIVLSVDYREMIAHADLQPLRSWINTFNASLRVIHVDAKGADTNSEETPGRIQLARALADFDYIYDRLEYNDVDAGILDYVDSHPTDLLVMIAHEHGLASRLFGSTHTQSVSKLAGFPLLVLKTA
ncbi:universal stress protein [Flaviaesturariibacter flavus]|nr:universal stress protein [Flaviaesturariibacter flavus]